MEVIHSHCLKIVKPCEHELTAIGTPWLNSGMGKKKHELPESEVQAIARRLRDTRLAMGISQAELCRLTGIKPNTYNQWEQANGAPDRLYARLLRKNLGWTLDWIYEGDPSGLPHKLALRLGVGAA